jgi:hypothetical protein
VIPPQPAQNTSNSAAQMPGRANLRFNLTKNEV